MVWIILRLLVARLNSIQILFSVAINMEWPLFQLDVNNVFLYEDLKEKVYMKQPPGYVAQGENITCRLMMAIIDSATTNNHYSFGRRDLIPSSSRNKCIHFLISILL